MLPTHHIETLLQFSSPDQKDIIMELRNLVAEVAPDAHEVVHSKGLTYYHAGKGGPVSAGICQIIILPDEIWLAFIHGAFLPDPQHLLEGDALYKKYVRIYSFADAPWQALKDLIATSARFDPYSLKMK